MKVSLAHTFYSYSMFNFDRNYYCNRWGLHLPKIADKSVTILSDGGLGMAMFSLGKLIYMI